MVSELKKGGVRRGYGRSGGVNMDEAKETRLRISGGNTVDIDEDGL